jgi:hypothetical protein
MERFAVDSSYEAWCQVGEGFRAGELHHVSRNREGGAVLTPIARFFCTRPEFVEIFHPHWRVDCYVRDHALAPKPEWAGRALVAALQREGICAEPIWVSWHSSSEIAGEALGKVFELE